MGSERQPAEFLQRIVEAKRAELEAARMRVPQRELEARIQPRAAGLFRQALTARGGASDFAIIAEVKKASPSRGVLCADFHPDAIARSYRDAGARALSVLTDARFFQGSLEDLKKAKAASGLPVLRKDFTLTEYHLYEAAAAGADAVLLITAILRQTLSHLIQLTRSLGLDALVEVHTADELKAAVNAGADMIGVNNRDLRTFEVSLETSLGLIEMIPDGTIAISESGLRTAEDLERLRAAGYDAFLIGERFLVEKDPGAALRQLLSQATARATVG